MPPTILGLVLVDAYTPGYDAIRSTPDGPQRIQIKGRALGNVAKAGRISRIKLDAECDAVLLVLLDNRAPDPLEMWEASFSEVKKQLAVEGSISRGRAALGVAEFKRMATRVWQFRAPAD